MCMAVVGSHQLSDRRSLERKGVDVDRLVEDICKAVAHQVRKYPHPRGYPTQPNTQLPVHPFRPHHNLVAHTPPPM